MKTISRDQADKFVFDARHEPVLSVAQGESFVVQTRDASNGYFRSEEALPIPELMPHPEAYPSYANPCGGPVYIEGARPGDLLAVAIEQIEPAEQGYTAIFEHCGPFADSKTHPELCEPFTRLIQHVPGASGTTRDGKAILREGLSWDLQPMIGTLAVAPHHEVETSAVGQGPWGGNLDSRDFREGTTVYLNVYHPGALLYAGDVHASQGDTESYGTANECEAEVQLSCRVVKSKRIPFIRLEKPESIVSVYSYRPLEEAVMRAMKDLVEWLIEDYGVEPREAYMHTCINPEFRINVYQMVAIGRIQYTVGAELPKKSFE